VKIKFCANKVAIYSFASLANYLWLSLVVSPTFSLFKFPILRMAKKNTAVAEAPAAPAKRTPEEKARRKADKASDRASKSLTDDRAEKKASQKQTLKAAAKQLQKELDARMSEVVTRIRKETKAKLKEVVKDATRRLDVDTERMFEQALHTIVRHYDSVAPGRSTDLSFPAPAAQAAEDQAATKPATPKTSNKATTRKAPASAEATPAAAPRKSASRPASKSAPAAGRGPGRPKRGASAQAAGNGTADLSTPTATSNDGAAVDNV
jgi:hypothetical protein